MVSEQRLMVVNILAPCMTEGKEAPDRNTTWVPTVACVPFRSQVNGCVVMQQGTCYRFL
jgi:hypothetical protein